MPVLTAVDILGIQRYVFGSNRLRDVLAASWMVEHVTRREQIEQWGAGSGAPSVLLAAGGNAIIEFTTLEHARCWAALYSRWLHETAPGLDAVVVHRRFEERSLAWALRVLQVDVARTKQERLPGVPQLGLSVTASCAVTGLPATGVDRGDLLSPAVQQLRKHVGAAGARWAEWIPATESPLGWQADFPDEIDHMGRSRGQSSLVGVVHVDGNGVGKLIKEWLGRCIEHGVGDSTVREQYREWSSAIDEAGRAALRAVVQRAASCIEADDDHYMLRGTPVDLAYRLHDWRDDQVHRRARQTVLLPLRPVLLGGDDLTLLCDGRIALDLAVTAIHEIEGHEIPHLGQDGGYRKLTACAGVALVKAHAPFHRSYELAEDLCSAAKRARVDANARELGETGSWIDWHSGTTRPGEPVDQIRKRSYERGSRMLTMRPYPVADTKDRMQSWRWLDDELLGPSAEGGKQGFRGTDAWAGSRSRIKALRAAAPDGSDEVRRELQAWRSTDPDLRLPGGLDDGGHVGPKTPLLDAIELLDLYIRLERDPRRDGVTAEAGDALAEGGDR